MSPSGKLTAGSTGTLQGELRQFYGYTAEEEMNYIDICHDPL